MNIKFNIKKRLEILLTKEMVRDMIIINYPEGANFQKLTNVN